MDDKKGKNRKKVGGKTKKNAKGTIKAKKDTSKESWDNIIPKDQLSGSASTGLEEEEVEDMAKRQEKGVLPSPIGAAKNDLTENDEESDILNDGDRGIKEKEAREMKNYPRIHYNAADVVVTPGEFIEVDFESGDLNKRIMRGKVLDMYSDRAVPDIDDEVIGTPQDPAVLIEIYEENKGKWRATGKYYGFKMSELQRRMQTKKDM